MHGSEGEVEVAMPLSTLTRQKFVLLHALLARMVLLENPGKTVKLIKMGTQKTLVAVLETSK
jgi:hypothetical protein